MQIQFNSDRNIDGNEKMREQVVSIVQETLQRFASDVTRVEVHVTDVNSEKFGEQDKRCAMEARIKGLNPAAVTHQAATVEQAVRGAADKMRNTLTSTMGKLRNRR